MVCAWVSLLSSGGLPLCQASSDGVETSFAVEGVLSALQTSAGVAGADITHIETDTALISYAKSGDIVMFAATSGLPQKLAESLLRSVSSLLDTMNGPGWAAGLTTQQTRHRAKKVVPVLSKVIVDGAPSVAMLGLPRIDLRPPPTAFDQVLAKAVEGIPGGRAAIIDVDGSVAQCTPSWWAMRPQDAWSLIQLASCLDSSVLADTDVFVPDPQQPTLPVSATRLTVAPVGEIHRLVIVMPQDANVERATGAASGVKVDLTEHPTLDPGIKAFMFVHEGKRVATWTGPDRSLNGSHQATLLQMQSNFASESELHNSNVGPHIRVPEMISISQDGTVAYSLTGSDNSTLHLLLTTQVPASCYTAVATKTLQALANAASAMGNHRDR
ncbi:Roadblock/LAMTOR2 domain-containing protein [Plasmodiophora brassicae]|uniref:Roadblock/LAMTOR2 domain-containing protein n=1 Tax=Plasmodiophora brassicae TaxID=37360 RepID=A0A0G4IRU8_PLABS|nr:hypothetical protein PBRA_006104 [Plasmodiophora brassicae]SPQ98205.1 unnamed protein product [Plasmodiophora brassicae]